MRWKSMAQTGAAMSALLLACGCPASQIFPHAQGPTPPPAPASQPPAPPAALLRPISLEEPASAQAAEMAQKLAALRDENKVLAARVQDLQNQLLEKAQAQALARNEVRNVTEEVTRTREEIGLRGRELTNLRERAQIAEKENQANLKAISHMLEMMLEQEASRSPRGPAATAPTPTQDRPAPEPR